MVPKSRQHNGRGTMKPVSEEIRLRYLYRRLVIDGKVKLSFDAARRLVGPDCAYYLYSASALKEKTAKKKTPPRKKS